MKIFTDYHHADLYYSLHSLFEKRLDIEIYRPVCEKTWFNPSETPDFVKMGVWRMHNAHRVDNPVERDLPFWHQYLTLGCGEQNIWRGYKRDEHERVHFIWNEIHDYYHRTIDFRTFKDMEFDIIMPTHTFHYESYRKLLEYQPKAKYVCHVGNSDQIVNNEICENIIHSMPYHGTNKNKVYVHQELDSKLYRPTDINPNTKNLFAICHLYQFSEIYEECQEQLKDDVNMRYYGINCPDGTLSGTKAVGDKMQEANLGWSTKYWGGFGHTNMAWSYSGRALVTNMSEHIKQGGECLKMYEPGVTCIDLDSSTTHENCKLIRKWLEPENAQKYGNNAKKRFHEIINYEKEAEDTKKFLENLL